MESKLVAIIESHIRFAKQYLEIIGEPCKCGCQYDSVHYYQTKINTLEKVLKEYRASLATSDLSQPIFKFAGAE